MQNRTVKHRAHQNTALRQTQMEQTRAIFGMVYLQRVLQDQHHGRLDDWRDPVANACALRTRAARAVKALVHRGQHHGIYNSRMT